MERDGENLPLQARDGTVSLPVEPGRHHFELAWNEPRPPERILRTPRVELGGPTVNLGLHLELGAGRWVLATGGPALGPAVLFWGVAAVLAVLAWVLARLRLAPLGVGAWFLLLIGLSQVPPALGAVVAGWLLGVGIRARWLRPTEPVYYNLLQGATASFTLAFLAALFLAVQQGLLGLPDMQVTGHGSTAASLHWYQDRSAPQPPQAWVLWVPLWVYRALMLAFALVRWLRWGWTVATRDGLWMRETRPAPPPGR